MHRFAQTSRIRAIHGYSGAAKGGDTSVILAIFTTFFVEQSIALSVRDDVGPLFQKMFSKCDEAKRYVCGRIKTTAIQKMTANVQMSMVDSLK